MAILDFLASYWAELLLLLLPLLKLIVRFAGKEDATWWKIVRKAVKAITPDDTDIPKLKKK